MATKSGLLVSAGWLTQSPYPLVQRRVWVNVMLLLVTLFSTTMVGAGMQYNFTHNLAWFDSDYWYRFYTVGLTSPSAFLGGLPFSLTLLTILMAHEMGHYLACVYYGVDASLPYFLPSPMPVAGTFGAFIRIRSAIMSKRILFDIGIAGPIAGFIFLVPALGVGLAFSKVLPAIQQQGDYHLGSPALLMIAQKLIFPGVAPVDIYLHPVARAAWVGMFATALNLLPVGQLDGGHIIYALTGRFHRWTTRGFLAVLLGLSYFWLGWGLWAVVLFFFARKHPPLYDEMDAGGARTRLGLVALLLFVLCFMIVPVK